MAKESSNKLCLVVKAGMGTHTEVAEARDPRILTRYLQLICSCIDEVCCLGLLIQRLFAIEIFYSTCLPVIKCSLLLFYWRIFRTRKFQIGVYTVGAFLVCWFLTSILVSIFGCTPVKAAWDPTIAGARCINADNFFLGNGVLNLVGDLTILCMPMPMVWTLQLARPKENRPYCSVFTRKLCGGQQYCPHCISRGRVESWVRHTM